MRIRTVALLILALGLLASSTVTAQEIYEESKGLFSTEQLTRDIAASRGQSLTIRSASTLRGYVSIAAGPSDKIEVKYTKRARTATRSRAIDYIDLIAVELLKAPGGIRLELRAPNPAPWREAEAGVIEAEILVPESLLVDIEAPMFDVDAIGPFKGFVALESLGRIEVSDITGEVDISTANRRVVVENVRGRVTVRTSNAPLRAIDIVTGMERADFENEGGDITIDGAEGILKVRNRLGRILIERFTVAGGRSLIRGDLEPVTVSVIEIKDGQLAVNNRHEDIELTLPTTLSAQLAFSVGEAGRIEISNLLSRPEVVQEGRLNLTVGDGDAFVTGTVQGRGNIYVRGADYEN